MWVFRIGDWKEKATVSILRLIPMAFIHFGGSEEIPHFFAKNGEFTLFTFEHNSGTVEMVLIFLDTHGESPWHSFQNTSYA